MQNKLYVETGRYCKPDIPSKNRFCFHCKDEKQFCLLYTHVRKKDSKVRGTNILTFYVRLIDWIAFYAVSAIFQPCNGGFMLEVIFNNLIFCNIIMYMFMCIL